MSLSETIYVYLAVRGRTVTLRGKPAPNGNRAVQGAYVVKSPTTPVPISTLDLVGNERLIEDLTFNLDAGFILVLDSTGNAVVSSTLLGNVEAKAQPSTIGPFVSPGTVTDEQYLVGASADGPIAQAPFAVKYAEATAQVANTVGDNVLTMKNITSGDEVTFTFVAGAGTFKRATGSALLVVGKGEKYSLRWSAVGGTPGSDVSVILRTTEGE